MDQFYQIAEHLFRITGEDITVMNHIPGFDIFAVNKPLDDASVCAAFTIHLSAGPSWAFTQPSNSFSVVKGEKNDQVDVPPGISSPANKDLYTFSFEDVKCIFSRTSSQNYVFSMDNAQNDSLKLCVFPRCGECMITGTLSPRLLCFALWMAYNILTAATRTVAIHSSVIIYHGKAVLFLGESGTGKSTHTRLWREHIPGSTLLNDDSPILRIIKGIPYIYGSPWSGKGFCFRPQCGKLAAAVRLSQAPENSIRQLSTLEAFGALYPSCPPALARDEELARHVCSALSVVIAQVPVYHLACLPDAEAAYLSFNTIFGRGEKRIIENKSSNGDEAITR